MAKEKKPGEGYRWVRDDEKLQKGDQSVWSGEFVRYRRKIDADTPDTPGDGYIWVNVEDEILAGDEVRVGTEYLTVTPYCPEGKLCTAERTIRRRTKPELKPNGPGEGYVWVEKGDVVRTNDQFYFSNGIWLPVTTSGQPCPAKECLRREVEVEPVTTRGQSERDKWINLDPGDGYEWVKKGDTIMATDEYFDRYRWNTLFDSGGPCPADHIFRRKIEEVKEVKGAKEVKEVKKVKEVPTLLSPEPQAPAPAPTTARGPRYWNIRVGGYERGDNQIWMHVADLNHSSRDGYTVLEFKYLGSWTRIITRDTVVMTENSDL